MLKSIIFAIAIYLAGIMLFDNFQIILISFVILGWIYVWIYVTIRRRRELWLLKNEKRLFDEMELEDE